MAWAWYSCNKITKTWIQISRQNWNYFFSNISHQKVIKLTTIVSRSKTKWHRHPKNKYASFLFNYYCNVPEYVLPLADDDESLSSGVIGINVFQGGGRELLGELGCQPDWDWHAALQDGIRHRSIIVVVVIISNLKKEPEMLAKITNQNPDRAKVI